MKSKLIAPFLVGIALSAPLHAAIVLVDFGVDNTNLAGYNEITSLTAMATPVSLLTTTGAASGISISFVGSTSTYTDYAGVNLPLAHPGAATPWSAISGGKDVTDVVAQGLGPDTGGALSGSFTLTGLTIGQQYSMMLLTGGFGTGGGASLSLTGLEDDYSFTGYDDSVTTSSTYTSLTKNLAFSGYLASGKAGSLALDFTAAATSFNFTVDGPSYYMPVQGLAISSVPEPSASLLGTLGILAALGIRRRHN